MKIKVTPEWQKLPYASGTIDNYSSCVTVEISVDKTSGIRIHPSTRYSYDDIDTMYIRSCSKPVEIGIVSFTEAAYTANAEQIGKASSASYSSNIASDEDVKALFN